MIDYFESGEQLLMNESQGSQSNLLLKKGVMTMSARRGRQRGRWRADIRTLDVRDMR
jgi:hypothetical protein